MPQVIEQGHLFIAQPPLFRVRKGKRDLYLKDAAGLDRHLIEIGIDKLSVQSQSGPVISGMPLFHLATGLSRFRAGLEGLNRRCDSRVLLAFLRSVDPGFSKFDDLETLARVATAMQAWLQKRHPELCPLSVSVVPPSADGSGVVGSGVVGSGVAGSGVVGSGVAVGASSAGDGGTEAAGGGGIVVRFRPGAVSRPCRVDASICQTPRFRELWSIEEDVRSIGPAPYVTRVDGGPGTEVADSFALDQLIQERARKGIVLSRYKGLGEMNADELWETTMNPDGRTVLKVRIEDQVGADELFSILMGDQVEPRRNFIEKNALNVKNLDV
jgi:DNA gyrase subunit B